MARYLVINWSTETARIVIGTEAELTSEDDSQTLHLLADGEDPDEVARRNGVTLTTTDADKLCLAQALAEVTRDPV